MGIDFLPRGGNYDEWKGKGLWLTTFLNCSTSKPRKCPRYEVIYLRQIELENIQSSRDKFLPLPDIFCCDGDKSVSA